MSLNCLSFSIKAFLSLSIYSYLFCVSLFFLSFWILSFTFLSLSLSLMSGHTLLHCCLLVSSVCLQKKNIQIRFIEALLLCRRPAYPANDTKMPKKKNAKAISCQEHKLRPQRKKILPPIQNCPLCFFISTINVKR